MKYAELCARLNDALGEIECLRRECFAKGAEIQALQDGKARMADEIDRLRRELAETRNLLRGLRERLNPDYPPWRKWITRIDAALAGEPPNE